MKIYILSSGRPKRQITAKQFKLDSKYAICTVVPDNQRDDYLEQNDTGLYFFHNQHGIRATRQHILDHVGGEKVVFLDDDLSFYMRKEDGSFIKANPDQVELMFDEIDMKLDQFAHVGVVDKFMSHSQPREYITNGRYNQLLAYNLARFPTPRPTYRVEVGEEQDFNLQLLNAGRESCI